MVPWWGKIAAKIVLSRLPIPYSAWASLGLFRLGAMDTPDYALRQFERHHRLCAPPAGFVCLELGPGDALSSAVLSRAYGGSGAIISDVGRFASNDINVYRLLADTARARSLPAPDLSDVVSVEEMLAVCNARYLTRGLADLRTVPPASVDMCYSVSCLECIRADEFESVVQELARILKPGAVTTHWIDYEDHLDYSLNNLRFGRRMWESPLFAESGFYTNRLRHSDVVRAFSAAGFEVETLHTNQWDQPPLSRHRLAPAFRGYDEADLRTRQALIRGRLGLER